MPPDITPLLLDKTAFLHVIDVFADLFEGKQIHKIACIEAITETVDECPIRKDPNNVIFESTGHVLLMQDMRIKS